MSSTEATIARLTLRQLLARRRALAILGFAGLPVLLAALFHLREAADATSFFGEVYTELIVRVTLPIVALLFGTGAFGSEIDEGTAVYLLIKPIPRWRIALAKLGAAGGATVAAVAGATLLSGFITFGGSGPGGAVPAFAAAAALGGVLYTALFVALGLVVRRPLIAGTMYVLLWEAIAAGTFAGTRTFSIRQYVLSAADWLAGADPALLDAPLEASRAFTMAGAVFVFATLVTLQRLRSFQLTQAG